MPQKKMVEQGFETVENKDFVVGKSDYDLFPAKVAREFCENDAAVLQSGHEALVEESFLSQTGKQYHHFSIKKPLYDETAQPLGIVGVSIDISEQKAAEEREKLAIIKAEQEHILQARIETELRQAVMIFAGSLSHDLRTSIATLHLSVQTIKKFIAASHLASFPFLREKQVRLEGVIERMSHIIDSSLTMLRYAFRNEAMPDTAMILCSMWHCIHETLTYYPFLDDGERNFICWDEKDFSFKGNEILMVRVLSNLLGNALYQIRQKGQGEIFIYTTINKNHYFLHIKDTAGSVSPELVERLFMGYDTQKPEGTGVGLAFCKLALQQFGASIECRCVEEDCIEFILTFSRDKKI